MSDRASVVLAVVVAMGAWWHRRVPLPVVVLAVLVVAATRARPVVTMFVAAFLAANLLGARATDGLSPRLVPGDRITGVATLVGDPDDTIGGVRVDLRVAGRRWRATASDSAAAVLRNASAGERYVVDGRYGPLDPQTADRLRSRHIAGRLRLEGDRAVVFADAGSPLARIANATRTVLARGVAHLPPDRQALFTGVVLGDDRRQDVAEVEDFRAGGLSHLLAVSGQNVAFLFALAAPLFRRLRPLARLTAALGVLLVFGTITRWEPSVTRAAGMAAVALVATHAGRPIASVRTLALAASALVLVDPLLVHSIGFVLSTAACAGLVVLGPRLAERIPLAVAATLAAQTAVLPLLLGWFGPVPLASIPANVVAGPVAGPLMMWGIAAGIPAGLIGGPAARILHLPTQALLAWLSGVARASAGLPIAWLTPRTVAVVMAIAVAGWLVVRCRPALRRPGAALASAAVLLFALSPGLHPGDLDGERLDTYGSDTLWRRDRTVVVVSDGSGSPGPLVNALRRHGVTAVDVLVVTSGSKRAASVVQPVFDRLAVGTALAPANHQIARAIAVERPVAVVSGPFRIEIVPDGKRLTVRLGSP